MYLWVCTVQKKVKVSQILKCGYIISGNKTDAKVAEKKILDGI